MLSKGGVRGHAGVRMDSGVSSASPADRDLARLQHCSEGVKADVKKLTDIVVPCQRAAKNEHLSFCWRRPP
eukprot:9080123-Pyramimonas_sp.AAC.1